RKGAAQMWLEIVQLPQSVDCVLADLLLLRHEPATPMGHALGLATQGRLNDLVSRALIVLRLTPSSGRNLPDLPDTLIAHPPPPQLHGNPPHPESHGYGPILLARPTAPAT